MFMSFEIHNTYNYIIIMCMRQGQVRRHMAHNTNINETACVCAVLELFCTHGNQLEGLGCALVTSKSTKATSGENFAHPIRADRAHPSGKIQGA